MNLFFITGTSSGIGKALAELALSKGDKVVGLSRSCTIEHQNYIHHFIDLTQLTKVIDFEYDVKGDFEKVVLVNNAGSIGDIKPVGKIEPESFEKLYNINLIAPSILMNSFIKQYNSGTAKKIILNVSSGAAGYPIKSWSGYCASKAGLDHFCRVINKEHPEITVMSVAPGVVNTPMQQTIRDASEVDFEDRQRFVDLYKNDELTEPEEVADKLLQLIENDKNIDETVFTLRDL